MVFTGEDSYDVLNLIGKGSFGDIRQVRRHRDNMILCRKEIMWKRMKPREQEQLAAEMRILRDLQHKNIVRYISEEIDHESKMVYIYMEYCGNGDLYELIQNRKETSPVVRFSEHTVWQIFSQLVMALYRCHNGVDPPPLEDISNPNTTGQAQVPQPKISNIVLHRDIKPHNVFLDHNNRVKLGDFGLSKELRGQNLAETFVGTPFYMSPEIIAGRAYNAKSDIWSLGCVIYEMCAFEVPFFGRDINELNRKIKLGIISPVTRFGYSDALNAAIQSCLRQDDKQRPSAASLLRKPEIIMARQQLSYCDREESLLERESRLLAREKEVEHAIQLKTEEFRCREDALKMREDKLYRTESNQALVLQDSTQRKLLEAQHRIETISQEKEKLKDMMMQMQQDSLSNNTRPHLNRATHSEFLSRPIHDDYMSGADLIDSEASVPKSFRPPIGRAQTDIACKNETDPLNLMPKPSTIAVRPDSSGRNARSPHRRKSQVPMSRVRPEQFVREPLADQPVTIQGVTRALSRQDLCRESTGLENIEPCPMNGQERKNVLEGPRTPGRDLSQKNAVSPRKFAWPSPTRATARTLFADKATELRRENQRLAPIPPRVGNLRESLQMARFREQRQFAATYAEDDIPSPYIKRSYQFTRPNEI